MTSLPPIHLCIVQPAGYIHWMALLDPVRYYRWQLRRLGAQVTVAKNRMRHDAVNLVFGAHLGFDPELRKRYTCLFVNLEQFGTGGAQLSADYIQLLTTSGVVDYDARNVESYAVDPQDVPVVPMLYAPYLGLRQPLALDKRPVDLLFIGSMNERRARWLKRIEAAGRVVTTFDTPLYGEERDQLIRQAKAVVNIHFYESCRFEQVRAAHCLSLGTPVISERTATTGPHPAFEDSVVWLNDETEIEQFFAEDFATPACYDVLGAAVERFRSADPLASFAELAAFACGYARGHQQTMQTGPWRPRRLNLGSGKDYRNGWLNIDVVDRAQPDLVLDLSRALTLPVVAESLTVGSCLLEEGGLDVINADNVLEHVGDLVTLMRNTLRLLREGGEFYIEVPYEHAATAWQDPTHVRAFNEKSWIYYTDWFWYLGWYEHRFEIAASTYLDGQLRPCGREQAAFMRLTLRKIRTTPAERMLAQAMQPEVRLPDDPCDPAELASDLRPLQPLRGEALAVNG